MSGTTAGTSEDKDSKEAAAEKPDTAPSAPSQPELRDDVREAHHAAETRDHIVEAVVHVAAEIVGGAAGAVTALVFGTGTAGGPGDSGPWEYKKPEDAPRERESDAVYSVDHSRDRDTSSSSDSRSDSGGCVVM